MSTRVEKALEYQRNGMNCAQAVAMAFSDLTDLDPDTIVAMNLPFGAGIGASREGTCGAIVGAIMMLGLIGKEDSRPENMNRARQLLQQFKEKNQSVVCKELKGIETGVALRSCSGCVEDAATYLEAVLAGEK